MGMSKEPSDLPFGKVNSSLSSGDERTRAVGEFHESVFVASCVRQYFSFVTDIGNLCAMRDCTHQAHGSGVDTHSTCDSNSCLRSLSSETQFTSRFDPFSVRNRSRGMVIVLSSLGYKLLAAACVVYVLVRTALAFGRAGYARGRNRSQSLLQSPGHGRKKRGAVSKPTRPRYRRTHGNKPRSLGILA